MKRIFVHAGPGKTGTSAIQHWLNVHASLLREQGVLYPTHGVDPNRVSSGNLLAVMEPSAGGRFAVSPDRIASLLTEFEQSGCHTLLLSSEFFFHSIGGLANEMPEATFVVYVRDPIELTESGYNQSVKRHRETKPFHIGLKFQARILDHLDALLSREPPVEVVVRPYGEAFFVGGAIVSDLLGVVGIELDADATERINPSYTFEALEFMRSANHFDLGPLATELDRALQACPAGQVDYSLTPPARYEVVRSAVLKRTRALMEKHGLKDLEGMVAELSGPRRRPYRRQHPAPEDFAMVAAYLREATPELYAGLVDRIGSQRYLAMGSPGFYESLGLTPEAPALSVEARELAELFRAFEEREVLSVAEVARDLALHFEKAGDLRRAREFMEVAHALRPQGDFIRERLNGYRLRTS